MFLHIPSKQLLCYLLRIILLRREASLVPSIEFALMDSFVELKSTTDKKANCHERSHASCPFVCLLNWEIHANHAVRSWT